MAGAVIGVIALAGSLAACGGDSLENDKGAPAGDKDSGKKGSLVVGAAAFTESKVLAELYAQILGDAGYSTSVTTVKNRELYEPSLEKGEIDVVPEYAATIAEFLNAKVNGAKAAESKPVASGDTAATVAALKKLAEPRGLKVLPAGKAVDQNAFAVTREFAEKNKLTTLSDLGAAKIAVKDGKDQLVLTTTTDAVLDTYDLVFLEDDKKLQNADNVLPVLNAKDAGAQDIADALGRLTGALTTEDLAQLNRKVDAERAKPADVAREYLQSKGLIKK